MNTDKMNVAVVLTGHFRCWQKVLPNFKERIIDKYQPDIFIHTWNDEGYWTPQEVVTDTGLYENNPKVTDQMLIKHYDPVSIKVQVWDDFNSTFSDRSIMFPNFAHKPKNILSMFYKMTCGMNLLSEHIAKTGKQYDLVIRMRPDMILHDPLPDFDPNYFYTLAHRNHMGQGTSDTIQVGNVFNSLLFANISNFIPYLYQKTNLLCPHVLSTQWLNEIGMPWKEFYIRKELTHTPGGEYVQKYE